ncbi:hypothetical protein M2139_002298 [Enterococcus sp. PF1-24]|uniref:CPCC family cysteine-rich protein n=1 Tax=unclassified Enterococcus TaxID=2608891 RepID=UPI002474CB8E|nr:MULTISPECIES: CPCC family cysteine-rich protein [unclassified Enterococcus]MDH6365273.1 hypothetical protein [Enterococcus sp. PFB1-1]MDH6402397.1 hypothetical protein [Enterococcus sp. PF1-24]
MALIISIVNNKWQNNENIPCPCCGYLTVKEKYDICPLCFWEMDPVAEKYPNEIIGANQLSLQQAREDFQKRQRAAMQNLDESQ